MELEEIQELLDEQHRKIKRVTDALKSAHQDLDGKVSAINDELENRGQETVEIKTSFQESVEKVAQLEEDQQAVVEKIASMKRGAQVQKTVGQLAAEQSDVLKSYRGGDVNLLDYEGPLFAKSATTSDPDSAGALIDPYKRPGVLLNPDQPLTLRDLLTTVTIATNSIEYVREKVFTNSADYQLAEGDAKAESGITFEPDSTTVKTIAHWIPCSKQVLDDAPALKGIIDNRLRYGLMLKEETELLSGDGAAGKIHGILPQATAYDDSRDVAGDTNIDKMRHAILQGTLSLYPVDAKVLNPADWEKIELEKTNDKAYLFANPTASTTPRLWGKRIVEAHSIPEGTFLTGGFSMGATLWDRELINIRIAEQHADFFVKNMVAILAEERLALTVERRQAFISGSL